MLLVLPNAAKKQEVPVSENVNVTEAAPAPQNAEELLEAGHKAKADKQEKPEKKTHATKEDRKRSAAAELKDFLTAKEKAEKSEVKADSYSKAEEKADKDAEAKKKADRERKSAERAEKAESKPEKSKSETEESADKADAKSDKGATEDHATSKSETKLDKVADAIEAAGEEVPEQKKNESDKNYEIRLARALRDIKDAKAEALAERAKAKEAEAKVKDVESKAELTTAELNKLKSAIEKGKVHPLEAVHDLLGMSLEDLAKWTVSNADKAKEFTTKAQRKASMDPELAAKIERLEKAEAERATLAKKLEEEKQAETTRRQFEEQKVKDTAKVKAWLDDKADEYPFLAAFGEAAAADVVARTYGNKKSDALEAVQELEKEIATIAVGALKSEKAARALLKANPELKDALVKVLGLGESAAPAKPVAETKPATRTIASKAVPSETANTSKMTMAERKRAAAAELGEYLKSQRG